MAGDRDCHDEAEFFATCALHGYPYDLPMRSSLLAVGALAATLLVLGVPNHSALAAEQKWARVPDELLFPRILLAASSPVERHRVGLVLGVGGKAARVTQSCGDKPVDRVAVQLARDLQARDPRLVEMGKTKELEFFLEIVPPRVGREGNLTATQLGGQRTKTTSGIQVEAPSPRFPAGASRATSPRAAFVAIRFEASTGLADRAVIQRSFGSRELDGRALIWPIYYWKLVTPSGRVEYAVTKFVAAG